VSRPISTLQAVLYSCLLSLGALGVIHMVSFAAGDPAASDRKFYDIAQRYLDESMRWFPTQASINGYHKYDGALEDFSDAGVKKMIDSARRLQKELMGVERAKLSVGAQVDRDLLVQDCDSTLFTLSSLRPFDKDPLFYNDILGNSTLFITQVPPDAPEFPERMASLVSRMKKIPGFLEQARKNLRNPAELKTRFCMALHPGNIEFFEKTLPPLVEKTPALKEEALRERTKVIASLRDYGKWMEEELLPRSRGDWRLGKDLWTKQLRYALASDLTPEEITRRAEDRLKKDRQEMLTVARPLHDRMFPDHKHEETGDDLVNAVVRETLAKLSESHSTPETLFRDVTEKWIPKIKAFIRKSDIVDLPPEDDHFAVEPTPAFMDGVAVAFFHAAPAFEPELKKSFWVSSVPKGASASESAAMAESYLREYNDYGLQSLIIHEAFPGHYVQSWYALKSPMASIYKKVFGSGTFAEGWAVLAEEEMFTNGFSDSDPANYLVHKKFDLRVPMNALLDSKLHTGGMSEEEGDRWAMDLMTRYGFQEDAEARGKLRRAKITATQLSTYFVGFTELLDLLVDVKAREGDRFRLKSFNELVLSFGTIPPRDVRRLMFSPTPAPATPPGSTP
jgi:uncharacterized protein (DUF885 family)